MLSERPSEAAKAMFACVGGAILLASAAACGGPVPSTLLGPSAAMTPSAPAPSATAPLPSTGRARSPDARGPLALILSTEGGDTARSEGSLDLAGSCATLHSTGEIALLVWPIDRTSWNADDGSVAFRNSDGSPTVARNGDLVVVGGSGESFEEAGITLQEWEAQQRWAISPSGQCRADAYWVVDDLRLQK
jgi:hypothetical protein